MNGIHLKLEDVIMPAMAQYESSIGGTVTDVNLPHKYAIECYGLPVLVSLTEVARDNQSRHYSVRVDVKVNGQAETRRYNIIHNTVSGAFNTEMISQPLL